MTRVSVNHPSIEVIKQTAKLRKVRSFIVVINGAKYLQLSTTDAQDKAISKWLSAHKKCLAA